MLILLLEILKHFLNEECAHLLLFHPVAWYSCFMITQFLFLVTIGLFLSLWIKLYYSWWLRLPKMSTEVGTWIRRFMMYIKVEMLLNLFSDSNLKILFLIIRTFKSNYKEKSKIPRFIILSTVCKVSCEFSRYFDCLVFPEYQCLYRKIQFSVKTRKCVVCWTSSLSCFDI